jgi:DNA polymerase-3 subunit epsilon
MKSFVSIDFETATAYRGSICEIGITVVEDSKVIESKSWLVKPYKNEYDDFNIYIHGITPNMTKDKPSFKEVWKEVLPYLDGKIVVAHNVSFDMYALKDALTDAKLSFPTFDFYCSYRLATYMLSLNDCSLYNFKLDSLSEYFDVKLDNHHRAESDSIACAEVFLNLLKIADVESIENLQQKYHFKCGHFSNEDFKSQYRLQNSISSLDLKNIVGDASKFDEGSYFYQKHVCFTGTCKFGTRVELLQKIADIGGFPTNSVTSKTDILVVGQQDYRVVGDSGISGKQKKAMDLIDKGASLEIFSESDFLSMI